MKKFLNIKQWLENNLLLIVDILSVFLGLLSLFAFLALGFENTIQIRDLAALITALVALQGFKIAKLNLDYKKKEHEASLLTIYYHNFQAGMVEYIIDNNADYPFVIDGFEIPDEVLKDSSNMLTVTISAFDKKDKPYRVWSKTGESRLKVEQSNAVGRYLDESAALNLQKGKKYLLRVHLVEKVENRNYLNPILQNFKIIYHPAYTPERITRNLYLAESE